MDLKNIERIQKLIDLYESKETFPNIKRNCEIKLKEIADRENVSLNELIEFIKFKQNPYPYTGFNFSDTFDQTFRDYTRRTEPIRKNITRKRYQLSNDEYNILKPHGEFIIINFRDIKIKCKLITMDNFIGGTSGKYLEYDEKYHGNIYAFMATIQRSIREIAIKEWEKYISPSTKTDNY